MASGGDENDQDPAVGGADAAELSALADGSLDPARRAAVEARIAASPALAAAYERERRVVDALRDARAATHAPAALRARIEAGRRLRHAPRRAVRAAALAALALTLAVVVIAGLQSGGRAAPTVVEAVAVADRGPAGPAPRPDSAAHSATLETDVQGVYFPNWSDVLGWRATGWREDRIAGRLARTVFYEAGGVRIAYTIVAAPPLAAPASAVVAVVDGTRLRALHAGGRTVVAWERSGRTCVLSGIAVPAGELERLAAWRVPAPARA